MDIQKRIKGVLKLGLMVCISILPISITAQVQAQFSADTTAGCSPLFVNFSNTSILASQYQWDFGNGVHSSLKNPSILYSSAGTFDVRLIVMDSLGNSDTLQKNNLIRVNANPQAQFTHQIIASCQKSNSVQFTNQSTAGMNYMWSFGDGMSSTLVNPLHHYADSGWFTVSLHVSDSFACQSMQVANQLIYIKPSPSAAFFANDTSLCDSNQFIHFQATGLNNNTWFWDFGDGTQSSLQNPAHSYGATGQYTVKLVVQNQQNCSDTLIKTNYIQVNKAAAITISSSANQYCVPFQMEFKAQSAQVNLSYQWDFGNGQTAAGDSNVVLYTDGGNYDVRLSIQDQNNCHQTRLLPGYVQALGQKEAQFTIDSNALCTQGQLQFLNASPKVASVHWDFGDGDSSSLLNPIHQYPNAGNYLVNYQVVDSNACQFNKQQSIQVQDMGLTINASQTKGCPPLNVSFGAVTSRQAPNSWFWDFGDGDTSHQSQPSHIYSNPGFYDVYLKVENAHGCIDSLLYSSFIEVASDTIWESQMDTIEACSPLPVFLDGRRMGNNNWIWDFGNGDTLHGPQPQYTFHEPGFYLVSLQTTNSMGCPMYYANFLTISIDSLFPEPEALYFDCQSGLIQVADSTPGVVSWFWDFGDGTYSTLQSPTHHYNTQSVFDISLTVTNALGCTQSVFFPAYVDFQNCLVNGGVIDTVTRPPNPDPSHPITGSTPFANRCAPQFVRFSNPDTTAFFWNWDFGDGHSSSNASPFHRYYLPGNYTVKLITQNALGFDTLIWNNRVQVNGPVASYGSQLTLNCDSALLQLNDQSTGAASWNWHLAKSRYSNLPSPQSKYPYGNQIFPILLSVTDSGGCQSSQLKVFYFPTKELAFSLPDSICLSDSLTISSSDSSTFIVWDFGDGHRDSSVHRISHKYQQPGTYIVYADFIDNNSCLTSQLVDTVFVRGLDASFQIVDTALCQNEKFSFIPNDPNADWYYWKFGTQWTSAAPLPHLKMGGGGSFEVELTISKYGCIQSHKHSDSILVKPIQADFEIQQLTACHPVQYQVQEKDTLSSAWEWRVGNSTLIGQRAATLTTQDSLVQIFMKVSNSFGCTDSITRNFEPELLKADFDISDSLLCGNDTLFLTNLSTQGKQYIWDFGDGDTSHAAQPKKTYAQAGVYSIQLIAIGNGSCADTLIKSHLVHVSTVQANFSVNYISTCAPMLVNFHNSSLGADSWNWDFGNGKHSQLENPMELFDNSGYYDVSLRVTNAAGCTDSLMRQNEILVPGPIAKFSISDSLLCGPQSVHFSDSSINASNYMWFFGDGSTSSLVNPSYTYQQKGNFEVSLIASDTSGCTGYYVHPNKIKLDYRAVADFSLSDSIGCTPFQPTVNNTSQHAQSWFWETGDGQLIQDSIFQYSYQNAGKYALKLRVENSLGCADSMQFDSIDVRKSRSAAITSIASICENIDSIQIQSVEPGGYWLGLGFADSSSGIYYPPLAHVGIDSIRYIQPGFCGQADTMSLHVKEAPRAIFTASENESCEAIQISLEAEQHGRLMDSTAVHFSWKANGNIIGTSRKINYQFSPSIYDIDLDVTADNGCADHHHESNYIKVYDSLPPESQLKSISVRSSNEIGVIWPRSQDMAFSRYELYRKGSQEASYSLVHTAINRRQISFLDHTVMTRQQSYRYKLLVVDVCEKSIDFGQLSFHESILLESQQMNVSEIRLAWNSYHGDSIQSYEVYRKVNSEPNYTLLVSLNGDELTYTDTTAYCSGIYSYKVKAIGTKVSGSWSNETSEDVAGINAHQKADIRRVTVVDDVMLLVEWNTLTDYRETAQGYVLHRAEGGGDFHPIYYLSLQDSTYMDYAVNPSEQTYSYYIEVVNDCPTEADFGTQGTSIHLEGTQQDEHSGEIEWTGYKGWKAGVKEYQLQKLNRQMEWETIQILDSTKRRVKVKID